MSDDSSSRRITPWVGRLMAVNAVVLLLQQTIFTSATLGDLLRFDPLVAGDRPWTFVTYMFVHGGVLHLASNLLALYIFGPTVERRFGSATFLAYYIYCGIGAAGFSLLLSGLMQVGPFVGASGAILGVAFAFAKISPDTELMVFPIPFPMKAARLVLLFVAFDVVGALMLRDGIAHLAHLGGVAAGWLYFVLRGLARPSEPQRMPSIRRPVSVPVRSEGGNPQPMMTARREAPQPVQAPEHHTPAETAELDRVLDKISATGIDSLTSEERRFLTAMSRQRRDLH